MPVTVQGTQTTSSFPRQLSDGNVNGTLLGRTLASDGTPDKIGHFGSTPVTQPGSYGSVTGSVGVVTIYSTTQSPTSVAPNTSAEQAITVTGTATGQLVILNKPTAQAGLALGTARVSAANTVQVTFGNDTAATITPTASETYNVIAIPASMLLTAVLSPAAVGPNTTGEQQFAVAGVGGAAAVAVNKPTAQAGLIITGARSVSPGVLGITFANLTAATITPTASESYLVFAQQGISIAPVEQVLNVALTPASVAANTSAEQTFTVPGLPAGSTVFVNSDSPQTGLTIGGARVSALNTLAITFVNNTAAAITPTAGAIYNIGSFPTVSPAAGSSTALTGMAGGNDHAALVSLGLIGGP